MPPLLLFVLSSYFYLVSKAEDTNGLYDRMLPWTDVDEYKPCLRVRGDAYCFVSAKLSGNASDPHYRTLVEHSANNLTHYDRTIIHRGICYKKTCNDFTKTQHMTIGLEACLNATLSVYGLSAKVFRVFCEEYKEIQFDGSDYAFGAVVLGLLVLNSLGSLYDWYGGRVDTIVGKTLLCFSVRRNWRRLVAPPSSDPGLSRFVCFSAYRVIFAVCCVLGHTGVGSNHAIKNPEFVESSYEIPRIVFYRVLEIIQICFIMSGILLVYKVLSSEEYVSWRTLHKALLWRWLRFTPIYTVVLFFNATWMRYMGDGPFWNATMGVEINDCRRDWWLHLLYIHNYVDNSRCMIHSWSMAVDMQLTAVGLAIFFLLKSNKARRAAIALVLVLAVLIPAAVTYFKNVYPVLVASPEVVVNWLAHDPTFNYFYKRGHTTMVGYALGWAMGYVVFNLKESDIGAEKYKKYSLLAWLLSPTILAVMMTSSVFYDHPAVVSRCSRAVHAGAVKLLIGLLVSLDVLLTIVKANSFRTKLFNWHGWTPLARLSFNVYVVHMIVVRGRAGSIHTLFYNSDYVIFLIFLVAIIASSLLAVLLFVLVESPFAQATRLILAPEEKKHAE